jgi:ABC-type branched-subunit amino acid transport system ATPase component
MVEHNVAAAVPVSDYIHVLEQGRVAAKADRSHGEPDPSVAS